MAGIHKKGHPVRTGRGVREKFKSMQRYWNIHDVAEVLPNASTARTSIDPVPLVGAVPVGPCICMVEEVLLKGIP